MAHFNQKPGTRSASRHLKTPFPDVIAFDAVVQSLILKNPLRCTPYRSVRKAHPPVEKVREMYTAKFVYEDAKGRRIGTGQDMYNSVAGYQYGIAAVITNMANLAAHGGKFRHLSDADLYSVIVKCHDRNGEFYFLSINRDKITLASYVDDGIRNRVEEWADTVPGF